jgi:hypothetical protein
MSTNQPIAPVTPAYTIKNNQLTSHAQQRYYASAACQEARDLLQALVDSLDYNTDASMLAGGRISFVERHLRHLSTYPTTSLTGYLSNLKIMTRIRRSRPAG